MKKWILAAVLAAAVAVMLSVTIGAAAVASGTCGKELKWELDNNGVLTIQGTGEMEDYGSGGVPWEKIRSSIQSVVIQDGVTGIGGYAFQSCGNLTNVTIPDSVTNIRTKAFDGCSGLTEIVLPKSMVSIGAGAFKECRSLKSITIPVSVKNIDYNAFDLCENLTYVYYSGTKDEWAKISIGTYNTYLTKANIFFNGYTSHTPGAAVRENEVPASSDKVGFYHSVVYCSNCGAEISREIKEIDKLPLPVGMMAVGSCGKELKWQLDNNDVLTIQGTGDMWHFPEEGVPWCDYTENIRKVVLENGVTNISVEAFQQCRNLASIEIPEGVTSIGDDAFDQCMALTSIHLPSSVTHLGQEAFGSYVPLQSITVAADNTQYSSIDNVLFNKDGTILIYYPANKPDPAYTVPDSVTTIGYAAFRYCNPLTSVTLPDNLTSIEKCAFWGCKNLANIQIPASVKSIGYGAFMYCKSLTNITIPEGVTTISDWTFRSCDNLKSVTIPKSVTTIGDSAFNRCRNLIDVFYGGSEIEWGKIAISKNNDPLTNATIFYNSCLHSHSLDSIIVNDGTDTYTRCLSCGIWFDQNGDCYRSLPHKMYLPNTKITVKDNAISYILVAAYDEKNRMTGCIIADSKTFTLADCKDAAYYQVYYLGNGYAPVLQSVSLTGTSDKLRYEKNLKTGDIYQLTWEENKVVSREIVWYYYAPLEKYFRHVYKQANETIYTHPMTDEESAALPALLKETLHMAGTPFAPCTGKATVGFRASDKSIVELTWNGDTATVTKELWYYNAVMDRYYRYIADDGSDGLSNIYIDWMDEEQYQALPLVCTNTIS